MPVQIGTETPNFSDPTGLLSDCHRRIEMFLGSLEAVAATINSPLTDETGRALESSLRYFREAAPKHTADEEESLFPRLRESRHPDVRSAISRLEPLEAEHRWAGPLHAEVDRLGSKYLTTGNLSGTEAGEFREAVARLASMYKEHISAEDSVVFPLAARFLSQADKAAIADEMAARRKVRLVTTLAEFPDRKTI